ncbi:hypothetical protein CEXT_132611 [Caerostris extrusa]|uniref:Uncharacterized protein n=1 Tax=Caerostris extrusa TaxID=172846 RepID=A0AAV4U8W1_CAEEX|nr:hypothetical protein CEXT_132611 [Caerostris extrusa]
MLEYQSGQFQRVAPVLDYLRWNCDCVIPVFSINVIPIPRIIPPSIICKIKESESPCLFTALHQFSFDNTHLFSNYRDLQLQPCISLCHVDESIRCPRSFSDDFYLFPFKSNGS